MRASLLLSVVPSLVLLAACSPRPGELVAGSGQARLHAPVGIGTAGFGPFGVSADPSPFADIFPATRAIHGHPDVKAVALSRGEGFEAILVRVDMVAAFPGLRAAVLDELESRRGRRFDDALVLAATHTHGGPGRVIDGAGPYDFIADVFLPEHYERTVGAIADAVEQALDGAGPARVGHVITTSAGHSDRRCEDGQDFTDDQLTVLAIEVDGRLDSVVLGYAVHGTTVGIDELTLTGDVSGAIEDRVEASFDEPVMVAMFNGWGGDMSPSAPEWTPREGASEMPGAWARQDAIASALAGAVDAVIGDVPYQEEPDIVLRSRNVPIDRQVLGYSGNEFPYPWGAVFCGLGREFDCDTSTDESDLADACTAFQEDWPAPAVATITGGHIGGLAVATFPGEPVTALGVDVVRALGEAGSEDVFFVGYAQDYTGYALYEDDWWQGGYEATGTMWGPKQGDYLTERVIAVWNDVEAGADEPEDQPAIYPPPEVGDYTPYEAESAVLAATIVADVEASYPTSGTVTWTFRGLDPWLGAPRVVLQTASGEDVLHGGRAVDSDGYAMGVELDVEPGYREDAPEGREFRWTITLPVTRPLPGMAPDIRGEHRLKAVLPDGSEVVSGTFTVAE